MDDLDQRLLALLTRDARASTTDLARALDVSRGTVQNRIDRLKSRRVIHRFTVELGASEEDHQISAFALIRLDASDGRVAVAALRRIDSIIDISTLSGAFDLVAEIRTSSLVRLDAILDRIRAIPDVAETQSHIRLRTAVT
ncbi:AsnC family transcriptional regulator [Alphaproteobacteria bacterium GH1-50]|uniref:AsnC family transcriptional regulator n=1 Tax=Kangsaoukella pontilimi TaxID=2691042 RepID=A0A7C9IQ52_9RHOB|nr:Lrp/AsnC family transcriptional regulator [Kangsaoukella pontilimi]MXQ07383.1 AsnC family transcriptional regulator [Kangsaoukella pontilimi]